MSCSDGGVICKGDYVGNLELFILQATPFCNIDCSYCYLDERGRRKGMSLEILRRSFERLFESIFLGRRVTICWHAGEPLAMPIAYFKEALALVDELNTENVSVGFNIQTNATLISDDWCQFFKDHNIQIGVSLDGPKHVHDRYRIDRSGRGTFERVMRGVELLQHYGIDFHVISVVSGSALIAGDEYYKFFRNLGVRRLGINIQQLEGANTARDFATDVHDRKLREFIRDLRIAWEDDNFGIAIREFGQLVQWIVDSEEQTAETVMAQDLVPFAVISVDSNGDFATFSPELLGRSTKHGKFVFGNVCDVAFEDVVYTRKFIEVVTEINAGVEKCKGDCKYFMLCGGGLPGNKYFEIGSFNASETRACITGKKLLVDEMLNIGLDRGEFELGS